MPRTTRFQNLTFEQKRLAVDIIAALIIASIALALANLTWRLLGYSGVEPVASPIASSSAATDINPLLALAPFGIAVDTGAVQGGGDLTLRAIFAAIPASNSVALIAGPDGEVIPVSIGDATPGGVVEAIDTETVTLRTGSGRRILGFNPDSDGSPANAGIAPTRTPTQQPGTTPGSAEPTGVEAIRNLIPSQQQDSDPVQRPDAVAPIDREPSIEPSRQGAAAPSGYRVGNQLPAPLRAAGLRTGDVIRSFNGAPVRSGTDERELMRRAMAAGSARIVLMREGKQVSLNVPVR